MVFHLTEHNTKELFRQYCRPGGPLSRQNVRGKQYISRRLRCWILLVQMDPVIHLSEGHRSDMLLDLSGLTREERVVMVQASISDERDFDRVAEALIIQHPRKHLRELPKLSSSNIRENISERIKDERKAMAKTDSNASTIRTLSLVPRKMAKASTLAAENPERVPITRSSPPLRITMITTMKTWVKLQNAYQAHNDPVDPGSDDGEEALRTDVDDEENATFSSYVELDDVTVFEAAELDAIALLADTWNDDLDPEASAQLGTSERTSLPFLSDRTKGKGKWKRQRKGQGQIPSSTVASVVGGPSTTPERTESKNRMSCLWSKGTLG